MSERLRPGRNRFEPILTPGGAKPVTETMELAIRSELAEVFGGGLAINLVSLLFCWE